MILDWVKQTLVDGFSAVINWVNNTGAVNFIASGGVELGGTSTSQVVKKSDGGAVVSGVSTVYVAHNITSTSGCVVDGTGLVQAQYNILPTGGAEISGAARSTYDVRASGGAEIGDSATVFAIYDVPSLSGCLVDGIAVAVIYYRIVPVGGVDIGGISDILCQYNVGSSGGIVLNGSGHDSLGSIRRILATINQFGCDAPVVRNRREITPTPDPSGGRVAATIQKCKPRR